LRDLLLVVSNLISRRISAHVT